MAGCQFSNVDERWYGSKASEAFSVNHLNGNLNKCG